MTGANWNSAISYISQIQICAFPNVTCQSVLSEKGLKVHSAST